MIHQNLSGVFRGNAAGVEQEEYEDPSMAYEEQMRRVAHDGELRALQPINFEDKIMGGRNASNFMDGKFPSLLGMGYNQRVNQLTGKGGGTMEEQIDTEQKINTVLASEDDPVNKVNAMLGGMGSSSSDKMNMLLGGGTSSKKDISAYLGTGKPSKQKSVSSYLDSFTGSGKKPKSSMDVVASMLGERDKKKKEVKHFNFDMNSGFGKRAFAGLNMSAGVPNINKMIGNVSKQHSDFNISKQHSNFNVNPMFNDNKKNKTHTEKILKTGLENPFGKQKNMDSNIQNMFGTFGNPERTAKKRMAQQKGLPMFGDYDGDGLINILDCDPLDYMKQGEQHNLQNYIGDGESQATEPDSMSVESETQTETPMGNFKTEEPKLSTVDSTIQNTEGLTPREVFEFAKQGLSIEGGSHMKTRYADMAKLATKSIGDTSELGKTEREKMKLAWDKEKYDREEKKSLEMAEKNMSLSKNKFEFDKAQQEFMNQKSLTEQENRLGLAERNQKLKEAEFKQKNKNNDKVMFETELKSAGNFLQSLVSPGDSLNNLPAMASIEGSGTGKGISMMTQSGDSSSGIARMSGGVGSNPYAMAESIGEFSMGRSFGAKVGESVGMPSQPKSFASKVNDSIGNRKPDEVIEEERQQGMMQYAPQQNEQAFAPQPVSPSQIGSSQQMQSEDEFEQRPVSQPVAPQRMQPRPQMQNAQYGRPGTLPVERPPANVDWDRVSPDQVAPIDPQYAKYLAESKGETTYRRGPYRKG